MMQRTELESGSVVLMDVRVDFGYGVGEEGLSSGQIGVDWPVACVSAESFPWWALFVRRLGCKLGNVVVKDSRFVSLVSKLMPQVRLVEESSYLLVRRTGASALLMQGRLPAARDAVWNEMSLHLIVASHVGSKRVPKSWRRQEMRIPHARVGGVTDWLGRFVVDARDLLGGENQTLNALELVTKVPMNLIVILKAGIKGSTFEIGDRPYTERKSVHWCNSLVVDSRGLYPMSDGDSIRVFTWFGGQYWTDRELSIKERLAVKDIYPRPLCCENPDGSASGALPSTRYPLTTMQAVCKSLGASEWVRKCVALGQPNMILGKRKRPATRLIDFCRPQYPAQHQIGTALSGSDVALIVGQEHGIVEKGVKADMSPVP